MVEREEDALLKILLKIGEGKKDLRINNMGNIHPIYEALTALMRKELQNKEIVSRFAKDENSLREVIATDVLLEYVEPNYGDSLRSKLVSGAPLKEIIDRAAVYLSEGKGLKEGYLLNRVSDISVDDKSFLGVLKYVPIDKVYVEESEINKLAVLVEKRRKIRKYIGVGILTGALTTASVFGGPKIFDYFFGLEKDVGVDVVEQR